jgi:hypothetical protein
MTNILYAEMTHSIEVARCNEWEIWPFHVTQNATVWLTTGRTPTPAPKQNTCIHYWSTAHTCAAVQWGSGPTNAHASTRFHVAIIGFQPSRWLLKTIGRTLMEHLPSFWRTMVYIATETMCPRQPLPSLGVGPQSQLKLVLPRDRNK